MEIIFLNEDKKENLALLNEYDSSFENICGILNCNYLNVLEIKNDYVAVYDETHQNKGNPTLVFLDENLQSYDFLFGPICIVKIPFSLKGKNKFLGFDSCELIELNERICFIDYKTSNNISYTSYAYLKNKMEDFDEFNINDINFISDNDIFHSNETFELGNYIVFFPSSKL